MNSSKELVERILEIEWDMFQTVKNIGGKASCQDNKKEFYLMRSSQFRSWSDEILDSYLDDLKEAYGKGRNLLTEKYTRMMKSTSPEEYNGIKNQLPALEEGIIFLVDEITEVVIAWEEELIQEFPHISSRSRPLYSSRDNKLSTSKETYFRCELATYSIKTLDLYYKWLMEQKDKGVNLSRIILEEMVKQSGYTSIEAAEERIKNEK